MTPPGSLVAQGLDDGGQATPACTRSNPALVELSHPLEIKFQNVCSFWEMQCRSVVLQCKMSKDLSSRKYARVGDGYDRDEE